MIGGLSEVEVIGALDRGAHSHVFRAKQRRTDRQLAMKVVKCDSKQSTTYRRLQNEIAIHMQLDHPNVVKFMGGFDYRSDLYIFTEYCSMGSMEQLLKERELEIQEVRDLARQIGLGLQYLHSMKVVHRDLKLSNIFLTEQMQVKIGDFGYAITEGDQDARICGTPKYMSPEVVNKEPYGCKTDVWAFGVLLYQMVCGCSPFEAASYHELFNLIKKGSYQLNLVADPVVRTLIADCLQSDASKRLTAQQILGHEFFMGASLVRRKLEPDFEESYLVSIFTLLAKLEHPEFISLDECQLMLSNQQVVVNRGSKTITLKLGSVRAESPRKCHSYIGGEVRVFELSHPQLCSWLLRAVQTVMASRPLC